MFYWLKCLSALRELIFSTVTATKTPTREVEPGVNSKYALLILIGVLLVLVGILVKERKAPMGRGALLGRRGHLEDK